MDNFISEYTKTCKRIVEKYGYKHKKRVFVRVINDVCQSFFVEKLGLTPNGRKCRVCFAVLPLCQRLDEKQVLDGIGKYSLKNFETAHWTKGDCWYYKTDPSSIKECISEIMRYIMIYLLPFFERANNCNSALQELINIEKLFNDNRKASLELAGIADNAGLYAELNILDSAKYYMALKNNDFDFALNSRKALEHNNANAYNSAFERGEMTEEAQLLREKDLEELREEIKNLEARNLNYFRRLIEENEISSREALRDIL